MVSYFLYYYGYKLKGEYKYDRYNTFKCEIEVMLGEKRILPGQGYVTSYTRTTTWKSSGTTEERPEHTNVSSVEVERPYVVRIYVRDVLAL